MSDRQRLIRGSQVITQQGVSQADILIQGEWIIAVAPDLEAGQAEVIEAQGFYALPGAIDAHVHFRDPGATHKEDFTSGSQAALAGGVTTVLDMPNTPLPTDSPDAFEEKARMAAAKACCDFGLFIGATGENAEQVAGVAGAAGLKLYMGSSTGSLLVADLAGQQRQFGTYPADRPLAVHAEDEEAVRLYSEGERRPPICAELAVGRAIALARRNRRRLHVCHVSTRAELDAIALARSQGVAVTCEVAPHHLFLSQADEARLGPLAVMNPPLRCEDEVQALWQGLGQVGMVASDHAPHTLAEKQGPKPPAGVPGVETSLPLLFDAALWGRLSLPHLVALTAANPATLYHLPHKGRIAAGFHADITLIDPEESLVLGQRLYTKCGWTPFAGRRLRGRIERVLLRGSDACVQGEVVVPPGYGHFVSPR
jgi:dihydroorotase (multifunctional complex type)